MRTTTEVGKVTLCIGGDGTVFKVLLNVLALVGLAVGSKLLQGIGLGHLLANHCFFLGSQLLHFFFNLGKIALLDHFAVGQQHIIEESILDSRSETKLNARIQLLQSLGQQVCRCVPEGMLTLLVVPLIERNGSVLVDRTVQLYSLTIHSASDNAACQGR